MDITRAPYPTYAPARRIQTRAAKSRWPVFLLITGLFSLALLPGMLLSGVYALYMATGRILPTIAIDNVAVGSMTRAEAEARIDAAWNQERVLVASDGQRTWQVKPLEMGLWVDPQATVEQAYQIGRGPDGLREIFWLLTGSSASIQPHMVISVDAARNGLVRLATSVNQPAQNAGLVYQDNHWQTVAAQNGLDLNIEATVQQMLAEPREILISGYLPLVTQTITPQVQDATPLLQRLQVALDQPLRVVAYDPVSDELIEWNVPKETLAGWLTVDVSGSDLSFSLGGSHLADFVQQQVASLTTPRSIETFDAPPQLASLWLAGDPVTVLLRREPTTYTVVVGDTLTRIGFKVGMPYWKIQQANPDVDGNALSAGMQLTIPSPNEMLPLPIVMNKRIIVSISEQRMWTYENGSQRSEYVISTGISRSPTYPGIYQVQTHELNAYASVWDLDMPHFMGIYEGWPGFMNGIHGLPTLSSGVQLWASVLGRPASYGCIILNLQDAADLYNWAEEGVIVEIRN